MKAPPVRTHGSGGSFVLGREPWALQELSVRTSRMQHPDVTSSLQAGAPGTCSKELRCATGSSATALLQAGQGRAEMRQDVPTYLPASTPRLPLFSFDTLCARPVLCCAPGEPEGSGQQQRGPRHLRALAGAGDAAAGQDRFKKGLNTLFNTHICSA